MTAIVLTLANEKGGVGKTTLATQLASLWAERGQRVMLVDLDPNGLTLQWHRRGSGDDVRRPEASTLSNLRHLPRLAADFDLVVIDTKGALDREHSQAVMLADCVLVPVQPSAADEDGVDSVLAILRHAQTAGGRGDLEAAAVLSRCGRSLLEASITRKVLERKHIRVLDTEIGDLVEFRRAYRKGTSVTQAYARSKAAEQVRSLAKELDSL